VLNCKYTKGCYFINYTIKNNVEFITNFRNNFCKGYYTQCAIWNVLNSTKNHEKVYKILPFEHSKARELSEEGKNTNK